MDKTKKKNLESNINIIYLTEFLDGLWFALPVYVIFLLDNRMSLIQIGLILGAASIMPFFFDIPSSVWADKYSRKSVIFISSVAFTLSNVIFYFSNSFELFFLGSCFNGIGIALSMGIFDAFAYDTLLSLGREKQYVNIQSRIMKSAFAGRFLASIVGAYIYSINPRAVFLLSTITGIIYTAVILYIKEPPREKSISKPYHQVKEGTKFLLKNKPVWNLVVVFSVMVATCDVLFNYYQPVLKASGVSVAYFGIIYAFINVFSYLGAGLYPKIKLKMDWKGMMVFYFTVAFISSIFFSTQIATLVLLSIIFMSLSFGSFNIFIDNIIHRTVPSSHRATTLSIRGQIYMLSYFILINATGFFIDHGSITMGMFINAFIVLLVFLVFLRTSYDKSAVLQAE